MASASLLINGMKPSVVSSMEQKGINSFNCTYADIEPFDAELLARVQSLHREIEQKTLEITSLRRSTPAEAAVLFQQFCDQKDDAPVPETAPTSKVEPPIEIPRESEIKETFTHSMKILKDLKKGVPATSAKLERAKEVVTHVYS